MNTLIIFFLLHYKLAEKAHIFTSLNNLYIQSENNNVWLEAYIYFKFHSKNKSSSEKRAFILIESSFPIYDKFLYKWTAGEFFLSFACQIIW